VKTQVQAIRKLTDNSLQNSAALTPTFIFSAQEGRSRVFKDLARRLEWTITNHVFETGRFKRAWLDYASARYIPKSKGGIDQRGIVAMANELVGRRVKRNFATSWNIVMEWLCERLGPKVTSFDENIILVT
jgi:hypothetical protein